ncbi:MAG: hypothetical protein INR69_09075, partial [Mucilaginibacter polytrichastri]|nr:hypothetical protein [Mucilaginibacter polytrichastri]
MNIRYIYLLAGTGLFLGSCASQQQLAQVDRSDNVYYSEAKAIEKREPVRQYVDEAPVAQGSMDPNDAYYYDGDSYANRLDRFYSYSPWRSYYDPFWGGGGYDNWYGG